jgi:hypothetical protein
VYSWLKRKDRFGEAAETNTRAACAPQSRINRAIRGLSPIRFNDSTIQRFNGSEAIRVHSCPFVVKIRRWLRLTTGE